MQKTVDQPMFPLSEEARTALHYRYLTQALSLIPALMILVFLVDMLFRSGLPAMPIQWFIIIQMNLIFVLQLILRKRLGMSRSSNFFWFLVIAPEVFWLMALFGALTM